MKIITYNVNGIRSAINKNWLAWLQATDADVVCLQELKAPDDKFPLAALNKSGYGAIFNGQKAWNGVAILARGETPQETRRGLPGDPADLHSRYIEATVNAPRHDYDRRRGRHP